MKGFPASLNTKEDYEYIRDKFPTGEWKPAYQALLDTASDWFFVKNLEEGEEAPAGDNYKVVKGQTTGEETQPDALYEFRESPTAKVFQIGFTIEEVKEALAA